MTIQPLCVGSFWLRHIAGTRWGTRRYLNMELFKEMEKEEAAA
ncbi:hypothetical protein [uncultured Desulfosarcina sp.]|nr:hypothetical protein [uncultured Desulfosarcina sp.]